MKRLVPAFLCILGILNGFFIGITYAKITDAGEGQGLAAAAIFLGHGVIVAIGGLVTSLLIIRVYNRKVIARLNLILMTTLVIFIAYFTWSAYEREKARSSSQSNIRSEIQLTSNQKNNAAELFIAPSSLGLFKPKLRETGVLYFYKEINAGKSIDEHTPYDSMTIKIVDPGIVQITSAPPWLVPEHLKLDYDILYFTTVSYSSNFVEVVGNRFTGQTTYVSRFSGDIIFWEEFLMTVNSVSQNDPSENPVRIKPLDHASTASINGSILRPIRLNAEWIQVEVLDDNLKSVGKGWIRWRKNGEIIITYSPLS
jgi:hypothetical protein